MHISDEQRATRYCIYIGMNDKTQKCQLIPTEKIVHLISTVCRGSRVSFSHSRQTGGYLHEDGYFVQEDSIVVTLIGASRSQVNDIAADLCAFLNQETVLVTCEPVDMYTVSDALSLE